MWWYNILQIGCIPKLLMSVQMSYKHDKIDFNFIKEVLKIFTKKLKTLVKCLYSLTEIIRNFRIRFQSNNLNN